MSVNVTPMISMHIRLRKEAKSETAEERKEILNDIVKEIIEKESFE